MTQFARPSGDITVTGFTGTPVNTSGNRYQNIDESTASDTDYNYGANGGANTYEASLSSITDPSTSSNHVVRVRLAKTNNGTVSGTGNSVTGTVGLYQGATLIATVVNAATLTGAWVQTNYTLSGAEADSITDYTDLRISFTDSSNGGNPGNRRAGAISWAVLEVPDAPTVISASFTADAVLKKTASATFSSDAVIKGTLSTTFLADGVFLRTSSASFTSDANLSGWAVFIANAVIKGSVVSSFTADAVIQGTIGSSFTADAALLGIVSATVTADAYLVQTVSASLTGDAVIKKTQNSSFTADAVIAKRIFFDDFNRTVGIGLGTPSDGSKPYHFTVAYGDESVNGTEAVLPDEPDFRQFYGPPLVRTGLVSFDFYVERVDDNLSDIFYQFHTATDYVQVDVAGLTTAHAFSNKGAFYTFSVEADTWYSVKITVADTKPSTLIVKVWKRTDPEPLTPSASTSNGGFATESAEPHFAMGYRLTSRLDNLAIYSFEDSWVGADSITADAVLLASINSTFSADAVLLAITASTFTADAVLVGGSGAAIDVDFISAATTVFDPANIHLEIFAGFIGPTSTVNQPAVEQFVGAQLISSSTQVFSPSTVHLVLPSLIGPTSTLFGPSVEQFVAANVITASTTVFTPDDVFTSVSVVANLISSNTQVFGPDVVQIVINNTIGPTGTLFNPTVEQYVAANLISGGTQLFTPDVAFVVVVPLLSASTTVFNPDAIHQTVNANTIGSSTTVFGPDVIQVVSALLISNTQVFGPDITLTIFANAIGPTSALFAPAVEQIVANNFIASATQVFDAAVEPIVSMQAIGPTGTLFDPVNVHQTVSANLIGPTGTLFEPLATTGAAVGSNFISSNTVVFGPSVEQFVAANILIGGTSLFDPDVAFVVVAPLIGAQTAVNDPDVIQIVLSNFIGPTSTVFDPANIHQTVSANSIGPTSVVFDPEATAGSVVDVEFIGSSAAVFTPSVEQFIAALLIGSSVTVYDPTVTAVVVPGLISNTVLFDPVNIHIAIFANAIGPTGTLLEPTVSQAGAPQTVDANLISGGTSVFAPAAFVDQRIDALAIGPTGQTFTPSIEQLVNVGLISNTQLFNPSTEAFVQAPLIPQTPSVFDPAVGFLVLPVPVSSETQLFDPDVFAGEALLVPIALGPTSIVHPPAILGQRFARKPGILLPHPRSRLRVNVPSQLQPKMASQLRPRSGRQLS